MVFVRDPFKRLMTLAVCLACLAACSKTSRARRYLSASREAHEKARSHLLLGDVDAARTMAATSLAHADRAGKLMPPGPFRDALEDRIEMARLFSAAFEDPNAVKVVARNDGQAVYFSRSPIPYARGFASALEAMGAGVRYRRHLGLYAYRRSALDWVVQTPATPLERAEKLEQLRFLELGRRVVLARAGAQIPAGVDTQDDLERVRAALLPGEETSG